MGLGSTTKKLQKFADRAEKLYAQVDEVREQLTELRDKLDNTHETVAALETKQEQNRALLEALADQQDIDVEEALTETAINDAETDPKAAAAEPADADEPAAETADADPAESEAN